MSGWAILFLATGAFSVVGSLYHAGFMRGLSHAWRGLEGGNQQAADCNGEARTAIWRAFIVAGVTAILVAWVEGIRP